MALAACRWSPLRGRRVAAARLKRGGYRPSCATYARQVSCHKIQREFHQESKHMVSLRNMNIHTWKFPSFQSCLTGLLVLSFIAATGIVLSVVLTPPRPRRLRDQRNEASSRRCNCLIAIKCQQQLMHVHSGPIIRFCGHLYGILMVPWTKHIWGLT